ncbi:tripartite tricarboxylate transporter substrate-binding protein, partial [Thermodesulfobacteriota bacterium]
MKKAAHYFFKSQKVNGVGSVRNSAGIIRKSYWVKERLNFKPKREVFIMIFKFKNKMNWLKIFSILAIGFFSLVLIYGQNIAWAQEKGYPNRPIKIIIPWGPGGYSDIAVRVLASHLTRELNVPIIIANRPGGSGMVGAIKALKAKPNGYTILLHEDASMIVTILRSLNPPVDLKDFLPICGFVGAPVTLGVLQSSRSKTIGDFVE